MYNDIRPVRLFLSFLPSPNSKLHSPHPPPSPKSHFSYPTQPSPRHSTTQTPPQPTSTPPYSSDTLPSPPCRPGTESPDSSDSSRRDDQRMPSRRASARFWRNPGKGYILVGSNGSILKARLCRKGTALTGG